MEHNKSVDIPAMDALLFGATLEVALLQIKILEKRARHKISVDTMSIDKRALDKLARDRILIIAITQRTFIELATNGEWRSLRRAVETFKGNEKFASELLSKSEELRLSLQNIKGDLENRQELFTSELENLNKEVALLRDKVKDFVYNTRVQLKYADAYLNARKESLEEELRLPQVSISRLEYEECVHGEMLRAFDLQIKEKEDLLEYWQMKYIKDIATITQSLKEQREKYHITALRRKELEDLYALHQGEMRGWLTFKKERAARLAREERARKAATSIQAWWRGVLVRRCLGPYRYMKNLKKGTPKPKKK